ncbi:Ubiquitin ligase SINAT3 [Zea mays]|uniref:Ubiquitin ligase SINAT3 n=1 Tax=Zea mays TaxID=4577 RepID=A0A1D6MEX3_MAIZE|nr:Ubiquitin ligase SINAT3 [Zea mays]
MASTKRSSRSFLYDATRPATYAIMSASLSGAPRRRTTHDAGTSPASSSGSLRPHTCMMTRRNTHAQSPTACRGPLGRLPEDGGVLDGRVRQQDGLQLGRGDLEALVLDELLDAVHDEHVAVVVDVPDVARVEPPRGVDGALRLLLLPVVALHHGLAPHADLPRRVLGQRPPRVGVHELHLQVGQDEADRLLLGDLHRRPHVLAAAAGVRQRDAAVLREPVRLLHLHARELALERRQEVRRERRGGRHDGPEGQAGQVELVGHGALHHGQHDRRHDGREHDAVRQQRAQERAQVEAVHHHHRALVPQRGAADAGDAVDVEEGHQAQGDHLPDQLLPDGEHGGAEAGHQVPVAQHHALGHPRRTRRVGERAQVGLLRRLKRHHRRARAVRHGEELVPAYGAGKPRHVPDADHRHASVLHLVVGHRVGDHEPGLGVLHLLLDLGGDGARVHAGEDRSGGHDPEAHHGVHRQVRERDHHDVAPADADGPQRPGEPRHVPDQLAVGVGPATRRGLHERRLVRVGLGVRQHELRHGDVVWYGHGREPAPEDVLLLRLMQMHGGDGRVAHPQLLLVVVVVGMELKEGRCVGI